MPAFQVKTKGPLLDGSAGPRVTRFVEESHRRVASKALAELQQHMDASFKNPTPYYETQVISQDYGIASIIHDRGIVYGPWLEGTGSRNATTRFKGYRHWRRTRQWTNRNVRSILRPMVDDLVRDLGGR